ncbi:MAG: hypothetical protein SOX82_06895 [Eubacteriales bacterium]|nr:hypothetical protein [Eubacteriales bacterium]
MIWFLLIIFLGIVIVGIATTEPPEKKVPYDPKTEDSKFALIVNKTFEDEICRKISIQTYQEKILDIIQKDLEYIYGKGWKEIFLRRWGLPYVIGTTFNSVENIVLMLLLSKSGFIPSCYRYQKISISNFDTANAYECLKIIHCIEKNIQNKRNDETFKIIFLPEVLFKRDEKRRLLELPQYDYPCSGGLYFAFQSVYMNSTYKIKDIHDQRLIQACKQASIGERSGKKNPYREALRKMLCKQYLTTFDKVKITGISLIKSVNNNYWFLPQDRIRQC